MEKKYIYEEIDKKSDELFKLSDAIWDEAELAFDEYKSSEKLIKTLENNGFDVKKGIAGIETAFYGKFGSGKPVIGFLGEFDALDNLSQEAGCTYKKPIVEGGTGHACGHNLLGAGNMAAALGLKEYLEKTKKSGTVVYFGCPGEEGGSGKAFMAREGVFDDVDIALSWHPGDTNSVSSGSSLANIQAIYRFKGISAHAAVSPEKGRSALDAVELMDVGANYLREHVVSDARIHYAITNTGGPYPGVVQPDAEVVYLIRAPKINQVQEIYKRINNIAAGAALMTETTVEIDFVKACSETIPNKVLEKVLYGNMLEAPKSEYDEEEMEFANAIHKTTDDGDEYLLKYIEELPEAEQDHIRKNRGKSVYDFILPLIHSEKSYSASTDVGDVSHVCPTAQISAASWAAGTSPHSWQVTAQGKGGIAHKSILFVGKVLAGAAIDLIENPDLIEAAKAEHTKRVGEKFVSPIPKDVKHRKVVR